MWCNNTVVFWDKDSLVTATWRLDLPSSITSMTSSGLETKRSVHPWGTGGNKWETVLILWIWCSTHTNFLPKNMTYKAQTLTYGTLFLSSWTDRLVFVTGERRKCQTMSVFKYTEQSVTQPCSNNTGATFVYISQFGKSKYWCRWFRENSLALTIQKVTDFIHVDFKVWNLWRRTNKLGTKFLIKQKKKKRCSYILLCPH